MKLQCMHPCQIALISRPRGQIQCTIIVRLTIKTIRKLNVFIDRLAPKADKCETNEVPDAVHEIIGALLAKGAVICFCHCFLNGIDL